MRRVEVNDASFKKELVHHEDYATVEAAKASLFEFIEVFYYSASFCPFPQFAEKTGRLVRFRT